MQASAVKAKTRRELPLFTLPLSCSFTDPSSSAATFPGILVLISQAEYPERRRISVFVVGFLTSRSREGCDRGVTSLMIMGDGVAAVLLSSIISISFPALGDVDTR